MLTQLLLNDCECGQAPASEQARGYTQLIASTHRPANSSADERACEHRLFLANMCRSFEYIDLGGLGLDARQEALSSDDILHIGTPEEDMFTKGSQKCVCVYVWCVDINYVEFRLCWR
jgi:hypothetical protein